MKFLIEVLIREDLVFKIFFFSLTVLVICTKLSLHFDDSKSSKNIVQQIRAVFIKELPLSVGEK